MKNIILQHFTGKMGELEKLSYDSLKNYAKFCGAEYKLVRGNVFNKGLSPICQKMIMLDEQWDDYDTVVMVDIDMIVRPGERKNIFTDESGIGRHHGIQTHLRESINRQHPFLTNTEYPYWGGSCYRLNKDIRKEFRKHLHLHEMTQFSGNYNDEGIMHRCAILSNFKEKKGIYFDRQQWNHSSFDIGVENAEFIHIRKKLVAGGAKVEKMVAYKDLVDRGIL